MENQDADGFLAINAKIVSIVDDTTFLACTFNVRTCQASNLGNIFKPQTMCGWLKEVINLSGALAGSAKDIRAAGASTAGQANVEMSQELRAGDWQQVSTPRKFYFKLQKINMLPNILGCASAAP